MRSLIWFLAGAIALVIVVCGAGVIFLKTRANGFSARAEPSVIERWVARQARAMAAVVLNRYFIRPTTVDRACG